MTNTLQGFDWVVVTFLILIWILIIAAMIVARRPTLWIIVWEVLYWPMFLVLEGISLQSGNTLSDNLVQSLPLWVIDTFIILGAIVALYHFYDLHNRRRKRIR